MPEQLRKGQSGSVLAGVVALSLVMTLAAAGLVTLSTNTSVAEIASGQDLRLHYAAEAGAQLGAAWLATYDSSVAGGDTWPGTDPFLITKGTDGWETILGVQVRVVLVQHVSSGAGAGALHTLSVTARDGVGPKSLYIEWKILGVKGGRPCIPVFSEWTEKYL